MNYGKDPRPPNAPHSALTPLLRDGKRQFYSGVIPKARYSLCFVFLFRLRLLLKTLISRARPTIKRVWKGIFGIRDLTKIRCGNRENDKYIDGIRDLTVPREAGLAKIWARDAGFMFTCLSGMPEIVTTHTGSRGAKANQPGER